MTNKKVLAGMSSGFGELIRKIANQRERERKCERDTHVDGNSVLQ